MGEKYLNRASLVVFDSYFSRHRSIQLLECTTLLTSKQRSVSDKSYSLKRLNGRKPVDRYVDHLTVIATVAQIHGAQAGSS